VVVEVDLPGFGLVESHRDRWADFGDKVFECAKVNLERVLIDVLVRVVLAERRPGVVAHGGQKRWDVFCLQEAIVVGIHFVHGL